MIFKVGETGYKSNGGSKVTNAL